MAADAEDASKRHKIAGNTEHAKSALEVAEFAHENRKLCEYESRHALSWFRTSVVPFLEGALKGLLIPPLPKMDSDPIYRSKMRADGIAAKDISDFVKSLHKEKGESNG